MPRNGGKVESMADLTKNEEIMLLTVWRLRDVAYGVSIREHLRSITDKEWNFGTLYCALDQLMKKGFLTKMPGKPMPKRGGRRKIYYRITRDGVDALREAYKLQQSVWDGVTPKVLERELER
jgi:DNA-binding PadR family transcriptional regulator